MSHEPPSHLLLLSMHGAVQLDGAVATTADTNNHHAELLGLVLDLDAESTRDGLGVVHTDSRRGKKRIEPRLHANTCNTQQTISASRSTSLRSWLLMCHD